MATINYKDINDEIIRLSIRISKGFDENGKRKRIQYHLDLNKKEYPDEQSQLQKFNQYLIEQGEKAILKEQIDNEVIKLARKIVSIPLVDIEQNPNNVGYQYDYDYINHLALSIKEDGLNNPIHIIKQKNGKYLINKGEKRYLACKELGYETIECYIMNEKQEIEEGIATLQLLRDNVFTYERTIKDKILEVEKYNEIAPILKEKGYFKEKERTVEFIAREMHISDKSVKDYLKVIKYSQVKKWFLQDKFESLFVALTLCDIAKENEEKYQYCIEELQEKVNALNIITSISIMNAQTHYELANKQEVVENTIENDDIQFDYEDIYNNSNSTKIEKLEELEKIENSEEVEEINKQYLYVKVEKILKMQVDEVQANTIMLLDNQDTLEKIVLQVKWEINKIAVKLSSLKEIDIQNILKSEVKEILLDKTMEVEYEYNAIEFINSFSELTNGLKMLDIYSEIQDINLLLPSEYVVLLPQIGQ